MSETKKMEIKLGVFNTSSYEELEGIPYWGWGDFYEYEEFAGDIDMDDYENPFFLSNYIAKHIVKADVIYFDLTHIFFPIISTSFVTGMELAFIMENNMFSKTIFYVNKKPIDSFLVQFAWKNREQVFLVFDFQTMPEALSFKRHIDKKRK